MGALSDIDLLTGACVFLLPHIDAGESNVVKALEHSASTGHLNALRSFRVQRTIIAVGMFSLFESALQSEYSWPEPFKMVDEKLESAGERALADDFRAYRLAVNVLKHGAGRSHEALLSVQDNLPFNIRRMDEFFGEGDAVGGQSLVEVDDRFISGLARLIEMTRARLVELEA